MKTLTLSLNKLVCFTAFLNCLCSIYTTGHLESMLTR